MKKPEKKCPECKGPIDWKVVHSDWGAPMYNGLCKACNLVFRGRETPELLEGKELAKEKPNLGWRGIAHLPTDVQLGYLRETQSGKNGYLNKKKKS